MKTTALALLPLFAPAIACSHAPPPAPPAPVHVAREVPRPAPAPAPLPTPPERAPVGDAIYFDFDASLIRDDAREILRQLAHELEATPKARLRIEGNCDERGTVEYNLALGDQRARAAKDYLLRLGIPEDRIVVVTYGSERPRSPGHDEGAWAQNRRDDLHLR
jgi:peptidoglycan-associated lipoprotein